MMILSCGWMKIALFYLYLKKFMKKFKRKKITENEQWIDGISDQSTPETKEPHYETKEPPLSTSSELQKCQNLTKWRGSKIWSASGNSKLPGMESRMVTEGRSSERGMRWEIVLIDLSSPTLSPSTLDSAEQRGDGEWKRSCAKEKYLERARYEQWIDGIGDLCDAYLSKSNGEKFRRQVPMLSGKRRRVEKKKI